MALSNELKMSTSVKSTPLLGLAGAGCDNELALETASLADW